MKVYRYPAKETWSELLRRPTLDVEALRDTVSAVLSRVRAEGDSAVMEYEEMFDQWKDF